MRRTLAIAAMGAVLGLAISLAAVPGHPGAALAQDFIQIIETESFPTDNRVRTVIVERDLTPRTYRIGIRPHTRVLDNRDEIVAKRSAETFEARYHRSMVARRAIFDLYDRLSR